MADLFDDLKAEVAANTSVTASAIALIDGFISRFDEAKDDPQQIAELVSELRASKDSLAAAIVRGTPSEPSPTEPPSGEPV